MAGPNQTQLALDRADPAVRQLHPYGRRVSPVDAVGLAGLNAHVPPHGVGDVRGAADLAAVPEHVLPLGNPAAVARVAVVDGGRSVALTADRASSGGSDGGRVNPHAGAADRSRIAGETGHPGRSHGRREVARAGIRRGGQCGRQDDAAEQCDDKDRHECHGAPRGTGSLDSAGLGVTV